MTEYKLMLDDLRDPVETYGARGKDMIVARSTAEAKRIVLERGMPYLLLLDHDLSGDDRAIDFLKWLANEYWDGEQLIPEYEVHSSNPAGTANMISFMDSWMRSMAMSALPAESLTSKMLADLALSSKTYPPAKTKDRRVSSVASVIRARRARQRRLRIRK